MAPDPAPVEARRALVQRVAASVAFQKTWRLRELFLYLCDRVQRDPDNPPRELEIGRAVFGRTESFDPAVDPLVRVQTSQLRKRLHQYFTTEGAAEPVVIEIPRGAYVPVFQERAQASVEPPEEEPPPAPPPQPRPRAVAVLGGLCLALAAAVGVLAYQNARMRRAAPAHAPRVTVERLWRQVTGNGLPTYVILADGSLEVFLDTTQRVMSSSEYQRKRYDTRYGRGGPNGRAPDPPDVVFSRGLMQQPLTSAADAELALRAGALGTAVGGRVSTLFARDANGEHFKAHNLVLSGPRRANPWIELFERRMTFRLQHDRGRGAFFTNEAPLTTEAPRYDPDAQASYCRVAFLENLDQTGSVLTLTGTDLAATSAGMELVTDERTLADFARALQLAPGAPFPPFEVLLRVRLALDSPFTFERVAHRASGVARQP